MVEVRRISLQFDIVFFSYFNYILTADGDKTNCKSQGGYMVFLRGDQNSREVGDNYNVSVGIKIVELSWLLHSVWR